MSKIVGRAISAPGKPPIASASLTPKSGITYTNGISGIDPATLSLLSEAISNNADITKTTNTVYVDYKTTHVKIDIGNQVTIPLNGTDYAFDIIGFNHDGLVNFGAYGTATTTHKAGITFQMHDLFATTYPMNSSSTNSGGWKNSVMRTSTMPLMKGYMPAAWQSVIKTAEKFSGKGGGSSSGTDTTRDDCFLLAEIEIFGSTTYSVSGEGAQYAYYKAGNSRVKSRNGSASTWWERSPSSSDRYGFCIVTVNGTVSNISAGNGRYVAFAFCI